MSTVNRRHKVFVKEMILHGDQEKAYMKAYPDSTRKNARVRSYKLLQNVTIRNRIEKGWMEKENLIRQVQHDEIQRLAREQIATQTQLEAILSQIALGTFRRKRIVAAIDVKSGKIIKGEIEESPTEADMISAADKLLRIKGAYAPEVHKHEAGDSWIEAMKELAKKRSD